MVGMIVEMVGIKMLINVENKDCLVADAMRVDVIKG